ncbi:Protein vip1 [Escovopsis weberi]|uniref:Protein vip1 n=1 Tax=Escovopsis weberi TaxID=150374 RepID=A0A0M8N4W6_ESCWE|nr:Protein vip1 [Escovopsis weberi]
MSNLTVYVKNISQSTGDGEIREFFSFCGKIVDLKVAAEGETKSAEVTFEKETATKTALLLNNTQLGSTHITVTGSPEAAAAAAASSEEEHHRAGDSDEITQEMKPRSRIIAEYLAHGYVVGDATIQRAIELDKKHEVSSRFLSTIQELDNKYHAVDRARATSQTYGLQQRATTLFGGLNSFFEQAKDTPTGRRIAKFYVDGSKEARDIHDEARRLAELKKQEHGGSAYRASGLERFFGKEQVPAAEGAHQQQAGAGDSASSEKIPVDEKTQ